jgi:hypothetical protein
VLRSTGEGWSGFWLCHGLTRIRQSRHRRPETLRQTLPCHDACNVSGRFLNPDGSRLLLCRAAGIGFTTTYNNAGTAKVRGSRTRHRILWVGLWVENLFPRCPPRAVFIAPHQLGMHSLRLALRRSGNYSLTDCLSDFGPASLRVHPGQNFLVARQNEAARAADAASCIDTSLGTVLLKNGWGRR